MGYRHLRCCFSGPKRVPGVVSESDSVDSSRHLNCGSLHKQIRRNPASRDVCSPVENHDLVPSLQNNPTGQSHSRLPKCDSRCTVQVESDQRMVTSSTGIKTDLSKVVHSLYRLFATRLNHRHIPPVCVSSPRPTCLGHRDSEHKLVGFHSFCIPSHGSPSQSD